MSPGEGGGIPAGTMNPSFTPIPDAYCAMLSARGQRFYTLVRVGSTRLQPRLVTPAAAVPVLEP
jgi:hypothetical protein